MDTGSMALQGELRSVRRRCKGRAGMSAYPFATRQRTTRSPMRIRTERAACSCPVPPLIAEVIESACWEAIARSSAMAATPKLALASAL